MAIYVDGKLVAKIGKDGIGVPNGGITGQVLSKKSDEDYDTQWVNVITIDEVNTAIQEAVIESWNGMY